MARVSSAICLERLYTSGAYTRTPASVCLGVKESTKGISSGLADTPEERQGPLPDASDIFVPGLVSEKEA